MTLVCWHYVMGTSIWIKPEHMFVHYRAGNDQHENVELYIQDTDKKQLVCASSFWHIQPTRWLHSDTKHDICRHVNYQQTTFTWLIGLSFQITYESAG